MAGDDTVANAPRRRRNPEVTRETILAAARTVLASDGPDGLSLSRVAHLAGVNRGTAYQHFETREDLIKATVEWVSQHLVSSVTSAESRVQGVRHSEDRLFYEMVAGLGDFAVENPELGRVWLFEILSSDSPDKDLFFRQFRSATEALAGSERSQEGIDTEVFSVMLLAGYFLWPAWVAARARNARERGAMSHRMRREMLRSWLFGTLRPESFPELVRLLDTGGEAITTPPRPAPGPGCE